MISSDKITEIYFIIDEFHKEFEKAKQGHIPSEDNSLKRRNRKQTLSDSEVICIMTLFHYGNFRNLKHFYLFYVRVHMQKEFPQIVSYNRFEELQQKTTVAMAVFLKVFCLGSCTGISFIDSTPLKVCHIKREKQHKVFKNMATKGQCSIGWFWGFKLHLIVNDKGRILDFMLTQSNVDDRNPLKNHNFHKRVFGKIYGDKEYIGKDLFEQLFVDGVHLVTKIRKNMNNSLMHMQDRIMLKKRALIETINDELKNQCQIEHTRHRSFENFISNLLSGLIAYSFFDKKPSLNLYIIDNKLSA